MVGQVVTKGYNSHVGHKILNADGTSNFTSLATGLLSNATTLMPIPQIEPLVQTDGYANPIKLGFALSLTFVVGVVQVREGSAFHNVAHAILT
ncbi:hypothetical protein DPMN_118390 [Dreissena polymorpha]|uniref:Uncharacterized protein n=1 Tax=Dreissena polymorpha TaxID=45954 RepID=A0A9D4GK03_DREPO|nr:hypothetical protein DPMN_118390 [Dreissena polymorpha]